MRFKFSTLLLITGLLAGCQTNDRSAPSTAGGPASPTGEAAGQPELTAKLYVKGMSCPLCANNIDKQLRQIPGVKGVTVDLGSGEVRAKLEAGNPPSQDQLARAIQQSGFTLDRIEMPTP